MFQVTSGFGRCCPGHQLSGPTGPVALASAASPSAGRCEAAESSAPATIRLRFWVLCIVRFSLGPVRRLVGVVTGEVDIVRTTTDPKNGQISWLRTTGFAGGGVGSTAYEVVLDFVADRGAVAGSGDAEQVDDRRAQRGDLRPRDVHTVALEHRRQPRQQARAVGGPDLHDELAGLRALGPQDPRRRRGMVDGHRGQHLAGPRRCRAARRRGRACPATRARRARLRGRG